MPNPTKLTKTEHKTIIHKIIYRLSEMGLSQREIAKATDYSQGNISVVIAKVSDAENYEVSKPGNNECRLTRPQLVKLTELLGQGAKKCGFKTAGWSRSRVHGLIEHHFGQDYSLVQVGRILKKLGYTLQKVSVRDTRRRGKTTQYYETQTLPLLKKS